MALHRAYGVPPRTVGSAVRGVQRIAQLVADPCSPHLRRGLVVDDQPHRRLQQSGGHRKRHRGDFLPRILLVNFEFDLRARVRRHIVGRQFPPLFYGVTRINSCSSGRYVDRSVVGILCRRSITGTLARSPAVYDRARRPGRNATSRRWMAAVSQPTITSSHPSSSSRCKRGESADEPRRGSVKRLSEMGRSSTRGASGSGPSGGGATRPGTPGTV